MSDEMELAGSAPGNISVKGKARVSISARVLEYEGGPVIEDLGVIVGKRTKQAGRETEKKLKRLRELKAANEKELNNG